MSFGPLVWSIVAVLVALVVLALLVLTAVRAMGRTTAVLGAFTAQTTDRTGMLRARVAALRVRVGLLRGSGGSSGSGRVGSEAPVPEGAPSSWSG